MAQSFTAPTALPYTKRFTLGAGDVCTKCNLPAVHGGLVMSYRFITNPGKVSTDTALTDAGAMGANYQTVSADNPGEETIPPSLLGGAVAVYVAAAIGSTVVEVTLSRMGP